ncbi:MAG: ABC transporter permease subunit [Phycisphaerales bacterium]
MIGLARRLVRSPVAIGRMFFGPIFQREVRALGRRRAPYWVRFFYTLVLAALVGLVFSSMWDADAVGGIMRQSMMETIAPVVLSTIAVVQFAALGLVAPVLTAGAIADEKRQRTLSTLLTTPLTSRDIVLGKLGSRTVQLLVLSLVPMPLLLALRVFGGVEAEAILASMALGLSIGLLGASLALMFSIWHRRTPSIVFFALCSTAVLVFLPLPLMFLVQWEFSVDERHPLFRCLAPVALLAVLSPDELGGASVADVRGYWIPALGYVLSISAAVVLFAIFVLRGVLRREASGGGNASVVARFVAPGVETPKPPADGRGRDAREVGDRPVLWRELRQTATGSGTRTLIAFGIGIAILLFLYAVAGLDDPGLTVTLMLITAVGLTAQAALSTPTAITAERDAGSWGVLLTTPVGARQIVLGKTLGSMRRLWLAPAVLAFHLLLVMATGWFHPIGVLHALILLLALVFMLASTGVCLGLLCRRGVTAAVLNMGLPLALFLVLPMLTIALMEFRFYSFYRDRSEAVSAFLMVSNPFLMLQEASTVATSEFDRFSFFLRYEKLNSRDTLRVLPFTGLVLLCSGAMAAVGAAALALAMARFNRWCGRPS